MQEIKLNDIFKEKIIEETPTYVLAQRSFSEDSYDNLEWHRDKEDREVMIVEGDGWYIQMENELPRLMQKESLFKIPKEKWHRIINKNGTNLIINVRKYK
jgi:quercetin dioxygenase-like cupin family protein